MAIVVNPACGGSSSAMDMIQDVLESLKVYAPGVTVNAADSSRVLSCMNQMLDSWSNERLSCYANLEQSFTLIPGKGSYTIGTNGVPDINAVRPLSIASGLGAAYLIDMNNNRYGIDVIEQDQWNQIVLLTETSDLPNTLFYDPQYPWGIINIFPLPLVGYTVYFDARLQLQTLCDLSTRFTLPPGYMQAIKDNLVLQVWEYFKQGDPPAWRMEKAGRSLGNIKRTNIKQSPSVYDSATMSKAGGTYNIYNDSRGR